MVALDHIQNVCEQIVRRFQPDKVIRFGSHAWGAPRGDSDVDLLVIRRVEGSAIRQAGEILVGLDYHFPLDLLVRTPGFVAERLRLGDPFLHKIVYKGKVLYDASGAGVSSES